MKHFIYTVACLLLAMGTAVAQQSIAPAKAGTHYGQQIDPDGAISVAELDKALLQQDSYTGKVSGEVVQVCKKKGCFLTLKRDGDNDPIMVRFTDYAYFVPQDIIGKKVILQGRAKVKETSVEWQQHYAEDMGKSKDEIAKINRPKRDISLVADGVLVVK